MLAQRKVPGVVLPDIISPVPGAIRKCIVFEVCNHTIFAAERIESGEGEGWTLLTRQIAFEPLPASVLFVLSVGYELISLVDIDDSFGSISPNL